MASHEHRKEVAWSAHGIADVPRPIALALLAISAAAIAVAPAVLAPAGDATPPRWALALDCARDVVGRLTAGIDEGGATSTAIARNRAVLRGLDACEDRIDDDAPFRSVVLGPVQTIITSLLRTGNEQVVLGRDGWLYYRTAIDHVVGRGFLADAWRTARVRNASALAPPPHPDPLAAIVSLATLLERRGVYLLVVPVPVKATVHPEFLPGGPTASPGLPRNASFRAFLDALRAHGVDVLDLGPPLVALAGRGQAVYLAHDTHWTPAAMEHVAGMVAAHLADRLPPPRTPVAWHTRQTTSTAAGDLAVLLGVPEWPGRRQQSVVLTQVLDATGQPWRADPAADILLLGDSFSNIYSGASLGWGSGAGLGEHLSLALGRPVDRLIQNDAGAHATREALARTAAQDPGRLAPKRVVIYQFAERELSFGDWRPISAFE